MSLSSNTILPLSADVAAESIYLTLKFPEMVETVKQTINKSLSEVSDRTRALIGNLEKQNLFAEEEFNRDELLAQIQMFQDRMNNFNRSDLEDMVKNIDNYRLPDGNYYLESLIYGIFDYFRAFLAEFYITSRQYEEKMSMIRSIDVIARQLPADLPLDEIARRLKKKAPVSSIEDPAAKILFLRKNLNYMAELSLYSLFALNPSDNEAKKRIGKIREGIRKVLEENKFRTEEREESLSKTLTDLTQQILTDVLKKRGKFISSNIQKKLRRNI